MNAQTTTLSQAHVFVSGRVRGVFYRAWTRSRARKLALTGWVRNLPDGRVEAVFQGPRVKILKMIEKCKEGTMLADVDKVDVVWEIISKEYERFVVIR